MLKRANHAPQEEKRKYNWQIKLPKRVYHVLVDKKVSTHDRKAQVGFKQKLTRALNCI